MVSVEDLHALPIFQDLQPAFLDRLAPLFRHTRFTAGQMVFRQGDLASEVYLLLSGGVIIRFCPDDGGCLEIEAIEAGGLFGWSAALGRPTYSSSAICQQAGEALAARGDELREVIRQEPELGRLLLERTANVMAHRLTGFSEQLILLLKAHKGR